MTRTGLFQMRSLALVAIAVAAIGAGAGIAAADVLVVTTDHRRCLDCSLPEASEPTSFRTDAPFSHSMGAFSVRFSHLQWTRWGQATARAHGRARIGYEEDPLRHARAILRLTRLRPHRHDGCGHDTSERIYTRAVIRVRAPSAFSGRYVVRLPRTGCETS
ncbi:MAG TPA: hypothetical protein VKB03_16455 [Conexibacter sp.]|nr:hypothetical protein [Conexibacter sp.]